MANICTMGITFFCDANDKEKTQGLRDLYETLEKAMKDINQKQHTFRNFLKEGCLAEGISARGKFSDLGDYEEMEDIHAFTCDAETAWSPQYAYLDALCTYYGGIEYASISEEAGFDIFEIKNDPEGQFYPQSFTLDVWGTDGISNDDTTPDIKETYECFDTMDELLSYLNSKDHYGNLFQSESIDEWDEFFDEYDAGHIRTWEKVA